MAEFVQYNLENSLNELEQLKRIGLFSEEELRKVIRKRKALEYKVAKMFKRKEDYLKYIQYEMGLLSLIRIRREKLRYFHKRTEIDNSVGRRISNLFKAAIKKFPEDTKLWFSHHDFLKKMNWVDTMTKMNAQMLQIHNKSPELWVTCAKWEVEDNNSIENARKLFQRALRFHPLSELVWKEYFRLELMHVDALLKRKQVLGVEETENSDDPILKGQVASVVYDNAVKVLKEVDVALSFIPICKEFDFTRDVIEMIYSDVKARFPNQEETLNAFALRCMDKSNEDDVRPKKFLRSCIDDTICSFADAVKITPTQKMWDLFIQFLLEKVCESKSEKKMEKMLEKVLEAMQQAAHAQLLSKKMYVEWIKLLYTRQDSDKARQVALSASSLHPDAPEVWHLCLTLHTECDSNSFLEVFKKAIANVSGKASLKLWEVAVEWATCGNLDHVQEIFEKGLVQCAEVQIPMKTSYLKVTSLLLGIEEARRLYNRLRKMPPLSVEFFETMIRTEGAQPEPNTKNIMNCYEDAVSYFGNESPDVWLNYLLMVQKYEDGNPGLIGKIYWRATKQLKPELCDEFVAKRTMYFKSVDEPQSV